MLTEQNTKGTEIMKLDTKIYDEIITVHHDDAYASSRSLAQKEGFLVGISSGAALFAAVEFAKGLDIEKVMCKFN